MYVSDSFCAGCRNWQYLGGCYQCTLLHTARRSDLIAGCNGKHHDPPIEGINRLF